MRCRGPNRYADDRHLQVDLKGSSFVICLLSFVCVGSHAHASMAQPLAWHRKSIGSKVPQFQPHEQEELLDYPNTGAITQSMLEKGPKRSFWSLIEPLYGHGLAALSTPQHVESINLINAHVDLKNQLQTRPRCQVIADPACLGY